jgi:hypothetical protein
MWRVAVLAVAGIMVAGFGQTSQAGAGKFEAQTQVIVDPDGDNGDVTPGLLGGLGYYFTDRLSAGVYGSWTDADRRYPSKTDEIWGVGGFGEFTFENQMNLVPYLGLRCGIEDVKGPDGQTILHTAGSAGVKIYLTDVWMMTVAGTAHWADDDLFNYDEKGVGVAETDDTNLTLDVGVRYLF